MTKPFDALLDSSKFSHRIVAEMLLDLDSQKYPDWCSSQWLILDLEKRLIFGITGSRLINMHMTREGCPDFVTCGGRYFELGGQVMCDFDTGTEEREYNLQLKAKVFKGYPLKLRTLHPLRQDINVSIPVEVSGMESSDPAVTGRAAGAMARMKAQNRAKHG